MSRQRIWIFAGAVAVGAALAGTLGWSTLTSSSDAAEGMSFPVREYEKGSLEVMEGVPVAVVEGTPQEIGEQLANLVVRPGRKMLDYPRDFLRARRALPLWPRLAQQGKALFGNVPQDYKQELEAIAATGAADHERLVIGNTMFDLYKAFACSTLYVDAQRSSTGGPMLGRNLDFPTLGYLHRFSIVTVYRPEGKRAFVSVGFPGLCGVLSGMNDAGLALAVLEVYETADGSKRFDSRGVPYAMTFRRALEECGTVREAYDLLCSLPRTTYVNLAVCDTKTGGVLEITPERVHYRDAAAGSAACTNHFRTSGLSTGRNCWRYGRLALPEDMSKIGPGELWRRMHRVNQGGMTLQTMIFEPATLKLRLAIGTAPSSAAEPQVLELSSLLRPEAVQVEARE